MKHVCTDCGSYAVRGLTPPRATERVVHYHNHYPAARKSRRKQARVDEVVAGLVLAGIAAAGIMVIIGKEVI